jgi:hypothetical protein
MYMTLCTKCVHSFFPHFSHMNSPTTSPAFSIENSGETDSRVTRLLQSFTERCTSLCRSFVHPRRPVDQDLEAAGRGNLDLIRIRRMPESDQKYALLQNAYAQRIYGVTLPDGVHSRIGQYANAAGADRGSD